MTHRLTAIIPCKDEAQNIGACIASVRGLADEILVADSGSTDGTLAIVRAQPDCRLIQREYIGPADFKNWAIPQASHPWVLLVDADERVTPELADEIRAVLSGSPSCDAYRVRFLPYFLGFRIRYCGWNTTSAVRLVRRDLCRYDQHRVHEAMVVPSGKIGRLRGKLLHFTCRSLHDWVEKHNRYSTWAAQDMFASGRRVGYVGVLLRPVLRFLQMYLLRGGIFDGLAGLVVCLDKGFYTFLKYAKLWELCVKAQQAERTEPARAPQPQTLRSCHRCAGEPQVPLVPRCYGPSQASRAAEAR